MKTAVVASLTLFFFAGLTQAETTVTLTGVHNCCKSCTNGITKAATGVEGVTVNAEGERVTVTAKTKSAAKKAVEAIMAAGYYGTSDADSNSAPTATAKPAKKLTSATVTGAHLCCKKCADAMTAAIATVPGIGKSDIAAKRNTFTVEGEFTEAELIAAMNKAGFHGSVSK